MLTAVVGEMPMNALLLVTPCSRAEVRAEVRAEEGGALDAREAVLASGVREDPEAAICPNPLRDPSLKSRR